MLKPSVCTNCRSKVTDYPQLPIKPGQEITSLRPAAFDLVFQDEEKEASHSAGRQTNQQTSCCQFIYTTLSDLWLLVPLHKCSRLQNSVSPILKTLITCMAWRLSGVTGLCSSLFPWQEQQKTERGWRGRCVYWENSSIPRCRIIWEQIVSAPRQLWVYCILLDSDAS